MSDTTSGGFMANLMDPATQALLGAAQGFGQAAMPSRMPVPFGAAIASGAGGMSQGLRNAYALQLGQAQAKAADIANQRAALLLDWYRNLPAGGGQPASGAAMGAPGAVGAPGGAPGGSMDANGRYLAPPSMLANLGNLSIMSGDPKAGASFYQQAEGYAGGPGYAMAPDGTAFAVPGGGKAPGTIATNAAAAAYGKLAPDLAAKGWQIGPNNTLVPIPGGPNDPGYIGAASGAKAFTMRPGGMHWDSVHGSIKNPELEKTTNPDGSIGYSWMTPPEPTWSGNTGAGQPSGQSPAQPPADPFPAWGQRINQVENGTGNPGAKNPNSTAAGNGQFIDQTWLQMVQATRPDLVRGMTPQQVLALRNNPQLSQQITTSYARQNAATLLRAGAPITPGTVYLSHVLGPQGALGVLRANPTTPLSMLLPQQVLQGNPQFQGKTAGDAIIWAQNQMQPAAGGAPAQPGAPAQNAQDGRAAPVLGPNGQPALAELSPTNDEAFKKAGEDYAGRDGESYEAALNTQAMLAHVNQDERNMISGPGWYSTGPYAEARYQFMAGMNDRLRSAGLTPLFDQSKIGSWQDMRKNMIRAGFELSSHYEGRARQAASVIENATSAVPGDSNTPIGFQLVSNGVNESAQQAIDLYNYKTQLFKAGDSKGLATAENDFYKKWTPEMYAQRAISSVHPIRVPAGAPQSVLNNYLPGTMLVLPVPKGTPGYDPRFGGKPFQVPVRPGAPGIPTYLTPQPPSAPPVPMPPSDAAMNGGGANG